MDAQRRGTGYAVQHILQRHAHGQELAGNIQQVNGGAGHVLMVQVGGDGIRPEALVEAADRLAEPEAAGTVAHIKVNAALPFGQHIGLHPAVFVHQGELLRKHMGVYIAWAQAGQDVRVAAFRHNGDAVHHHDLSAHGSCLDSAVNGSPDGVVSILVLRPIVGTLDADNDIRPGVGNGGGDFGVDVSHSLL